MEEVKAISKMTRGDLLYYVYFNTLPIKVGATQEASHVNKEDRGESESHTNADRSNAN